MILLALAHPVWVGAHLAPAIMSPDSNGYVVQARLIAEAGGLAEYAGARLRAGLPLVPQ